MMKEVVVFSAEWCTGCNTVKQKLNSAGIDFKVIDIETDEGITLCKDKMVRSIPVVFVDGKRFDGSSPKTLNDLMQEIKE